MRTSIEQCVEFPFKVFTHYRNVFMHPNAFMALSENCYWLINNLNSVRVGHIEWKVFNFSDKQRLPVTVEHVYEADGLLVADDDTRLIGDWFSTERLGIIMHVCGGVMHTAFSSCSRKKASSSACICKNGDTIEVVPTWTLVLQRESHTRAKLTGRPATRMPSSSLKVEIQFVYVLNRLKKACTHETSMLLHVRAPIRVAKTDQSLRMLGYWAAELRSRTKLSKKCLE